MSTPARTHNVSALLDDAPWSGAQKLVVLLTALAIVFDGADNQLLGIAVPSIVAEWGVTRASFAPVLASGLLGMMVGGAIAGFLGDRIGRRLSLIGSVAAFAALTLLVPFAGSLTALAVLRFLAGLGLGGAMPNAAALAAEYSPRRYRPVAVTVTIVCVPVGGTLAGLVAAAVLPVFGWRALFAIGGILPAILVLVLLRWLPESPRYLVRHPARWPELVATLRRFGCACAPGDTFEDLEQAHGIKGEHVSIVGRRYVRDSLALWVSFFCCLLAVYTGFNWVPALLTEAGLGVALASSALAAYNLGGVVGALAGGVLIVRFGSKSTMMALATGAVAGALTLAGMRIAADVPVWPIVVFLGITGGLINAVQVTLFALAAHVYPTNVRATGVGTAVSVGRSGGVLSPYAGAWALEVGGSRAFFMVMAAAMSVVFVALGGLKRHIGSEDDMLGG